MKEALGDGHTVDVTRIIPSLGGIVRLRLYSKAWIAWRRYGIYEVMIDKRST